MQIRVYHNGHGSLWLARTCSMVLHIVEGMGAGQKSFAVVAPGFLAQT